MQNSCLHSICQSLKNVSCKSSPFHFKCIIRTRRRTARYQRIVRPRKRLTNIHTRIWESRQNRQTMQHTCTGSHSVQHSIAFSDPTQGARERDSLSEPGCQLKRCLRWRMQLDCSEGLHGLKSNSQSSFCDKKALKQEVLQNAQEGYLLLGLTSRLKQSTTVRG